VTDVDLDKQRAVAARAAIEDSADSSELEHELQLLRQGRAKEYANEKRETIGIHPSSISP
jgi:hypothetical protein